MRVSAALRNIDSLGAAIKDHKFEVHKVPTLPNMSDIGSKTHRLHYYDDVGRINGYQTHERDRCHSIDSNFVTNNIGSDIVTDVDSHRYILSKVVRKLMHHAWMVHGLMMALLGHGLGAVTMANRTASKLIARARLTCSISPPVRVTQRWKGDQNQCRDVLLQHFEECSPSA